MKTSELQKYSKNYSDFLDSSQLILAIVSLSALIATFFISNSNFRFETKIAVFSTIVFAYLLIYVLFYLRQKQQTASVSFFDAEVSESVFDAEIENKLLALEEASQFFGAALKPADMFRLIASRAGEMIPFAAAALFWLDDEKAGFKVIGAVGENSRRLLDVKTDSSKGLAGEVFQSGETQADEKLTLEKQAIVNETLNNLGSAIAVPLRRGGNEIFAVLTLYGRREKSFDSNSRKLLEAVGERIAPLFLSSAAFERSVSNALTDSLTNLPNERAFYLILENQIAESQRHRNERPLTVLTVDIQNFNAINQKFGHATGDRILAFTADTIKEQLRKMDFLARSTGDEFLIVLPTATDSTTREIIERIEKAFALNSFNIEREKTYIKLNFGAATFWQDGETAKELLQTANIRKQQTKSGQNSKILWFPKEFVN